MRSQFLETLTTLAKEHPEIVFLTGDLGFGVVEKFQRACPEQFFNMGVAEQNMIGVATGLANRGFVPFTYSIINFSVLRPIEFIRNGPVSHKLPVRIVGVGPGFEYGTNGPTHYGIEDIACLRSFGLDIIVPADPARAQQALKANWSAPQPLYFRLSKDEKLTVPELDDATDHEGFSVLQRRQGSESPTIALVCLGTLIVEGLRARRRLAEHGLSVELVCVERINDSVLDHLSTYLMDFDQIVTAEAHSVRGGLGSALTEFVCAKPRPVSVHRLGISSVPSQIGRQSTLEHNSGFDADGMVETIRSLSLELAIQT